MDLIFFYIFAGGSLVTAVGVIAFRNTLSSAFSLVLTLAGVAALFALLGAQFLAVMQVLVYAGAIMVLFVFVIMLLNLSQESLRKIRMTFSSVVGILIGGYLAIFLALRLGVLPASFPQLSSPEGYGTVREVGRLLFTGYLIPFEIVSILLLVAIVGAIVMTKGEKWSR